MRLNIAELIAGTAKENGMDDVSLRKDYSGRCMYGQTTTAIVCDKLGDFLAAVALAGACLMDMDVNVSAEDLAEAMQNIRMDSMGRGIVLY